jgi:hypothetical protein
MMSLDRWRYAWNKRRRRRKERHLRLERRAFARPHDEAVERLAYLEVLKEWGAIDEREFLEKKRALAG